MTRIGLISDTHIPEAGNSLPEKIWTVFRDTDLILHAGDLHIIDVLDRLEEIAPVIAVRGNGDDGSGGRSVVPGDLRLSPIQILDIEGITLGMAHGISLPEEMPFIPLQKTMNRLFGGHINVIVFGDTHVDYIGYHDDVLLVNPGSPTFPHNLLGRLGTVGILEVHQGKANAKIKYLGK